MKRWAYEILPFIIAILIALFILSLLSCVNSQSKAQKKINRLVQRFPGLRSQDTIIIRDTIVFPGIKGDTVFRPGKDTVIYQKGNLRIKHVYHDSLIYLEGECQTDTIYKEIKVPVKIPHTEPTLKEFAKEYWWVIVLISVGIGALFFIASLNKK